MQNNCFVFPKFMIFIHDDQFSPKKTLSLTYWNTWVSWETCHAGWALQKKLYAIMMYINYILQCCYNVTIFYLFFIFSVLQNMTIFLQDKSRHLLCFLSFLELLTPLYLPGRKHKNILK